MKLFKSIGLVMVMLCASLFCLTACGAKTYTIQYSDSNGVHTISVESGKVYSLTDELPSKFGYEFTGLFDAETGGNQYVNASGSSLDVYSGEKDMVLYPQFKAKEYSLILDWQGAAVTGDRSVTVSYDGTLTTLPTNVSKDAYNFKGWYTEPNCGGTQVADAYGVLPTNNKITKDIYNITDTTTSFTLYAGFELKVYSVSLYFNTNVPEVIEVVHGTNVSDIVYTTRVSGNAVLNWSTIANDTNLTNVFSGKITSAMSLYAATYAPAINFNTAGGKEIASVVAVAGSTIVLPTPEKENYKFLCWLNTDSKEYTSTTMPSESVTLTAKWQAKIVLDENGGSSVEDISEVAGTSVTLPTNLTREGYFFAGWYDASGNPASITSMPSESVVLKAGWYKEKTETVVIIASDDYVAINSTSTKMQDELIIDMSKFLSKTYQGDLKISASVRIKYRDEENNNGKIKFYSDKEGSSAYLIHEEATYNSISTKYETFTFEFDAKNFSGNAIYCGTSFTKGTGVMYAYAMYIKDFFVQVSYADTSTIY